MKVEVEITPSITLLVGVILLICISYQYQQHPQPLQQSWQDDTTRRLLATEPVASTASTAAHGTSKHTTHHIRSANSNATHHARSIGGHGVMGPAYQCTLEEKIFQHNYTDLVHFDICADNAWAIAQFLYPDANMFFDIGGNRGYTAAHFIGLWSPGSELTRNNLYYKYEKAIKLNQLKNNDQINTFCDDAAYDDDALFCPGRKEKFRGKCVLRRNITVHSFDGQRTHFQDAVTIRDQYYPHLSPNFVPNRKYTHTKATWHYHHVAMTDSFEDNFTTGYFVVVTHETGSLVKKRKGMTNFEDHIEVNISTVDYFCKQHRIDKLDFLKIDAESGDMNVIRGANYTLKHRNVKMLTFECFGCLKPEFMHMVDSLNHEFGYDCYIFGWSNVVMRLTNCMDVKLYVGKHPLSTIVHCVKRHSLLYYAFENLSILRYMHDKRGDLHLDAVIHNDTATVINGQLVQP